MEYVASSVLAYNKIANIDTRVEDFQSPQIVSETISKMLQMSTKETVYNTIQLLFFPVIVMAFTLSRSDIGVICKVLTTLFVVGHVMIVTHQKFNGSTIRT